MIGVAPPLDLMRIDEKNQAGRDGNRRDLGDRDFAWLRFRRWEARLDARATAIGREISILVGKIVFSHRRVSPAGV
jgi:hypothetical protein